MVQPFRVNDGDTPGRDRGGWDENGNVDLPGILTVDQIQGSGSSTPSLTTVEFLAQVEFIAGIIIASVVGNLAISGNLTVTGTSIEVDSAGTAINSVDRATTAAFAAYVLKTAGVERWSLQMINNATNDLRLTESANGVDVLVITAGATPATTITGDVTVASGDVILSALGGGLKLKEGANATMGRATLVGGTVVVSTTSVGASSEVFLTCQTPGGTPGFLRVSTRTAGTSFTILSSSGTDTSVVAWMIVEPS